MWACTQLKYLTFSMSAIGHYGKMKHEYYLSNKSLK